MSMANEPESIHDLLNQEVEDGELHGQDDNPVNTEANETNGNLPNNHDNPLLTVNNELEQTDPSHPPTRVHAAQRLAVAANTTTDNAQRANTTIGQRSYAAVTTNSEWLRNAQAIINGTTKFSGSGYAPNQMAREASHYKVNVETIIYTANVPFEQKNYVAFKLLDGHAFDLAIKLPKEGASILPPYDSIMAMVESLVSGSGLSKLAILEKLETFSFYQTTRKLYLQQLTAHPDIAPSIPDISFLIQLYRTEFNQPDKDDISDLSKCLMILKAVGFKPLVAIVRRITDGDGKTRDVSNPLSHTTNALLTLSLCTRTSAHPPQLPLTPRCGLMSPCQ
jgi:hypothetical protein